MLAVTPKLAELIAVSRPVRVLFDEPSVIVWVAEPTSITTEPLSLSAVLATDPSVPEASVRLLFPVSVKLTVAGAVFAVSAMAEVIVRSPPVPEVPETMLSREPEASVRTAAVTPNPAALIVEAKPAKVLLEEVIAMVWTVPLPT